MPLSKEVCTTYVDHIGVASKSFLFLHLFRFHPQPVTIFLNLYHIISGVNVFYLVIIYFTISLICLNVKIWSERLSGPLLINFVMCTQYLERIARNVNILMYELIFSMGPFSLFTITLLYVKLTIRPLCDIATT